MRIQRLDPTAREHLLTDLLKRSPDQYREYEEQVAKILRDVRETGDEALSAYTKKFDGADATKETILVTPLDIE